MRLKLLQLLRDQGTRSLSENPGLLPVFKTTTVLGRGMEAQVPDWGIGLPKSCDSFSQKAGSEQQVLAINPRGGTLIFK